jgi:hypothetical protein
MTNDGLRTKVAAELTWNPKVDSKDITVSAEGGMVTLHGTVASCRHKREADNAARRVHGVTGISSYLEVRIPNQGRRAFTDLVRGVADVPGVGTGGWMTRRVVVGDLRVSLAAWRHPDQEITTSASSRYRPQYWGAEGWPRGVYWLWGW